jgi:formate hydrogenlyase subunit 6/NADH:ubiquinone oxidoreductase subunit I
MMDGFDQLIRDVIETNLCVSCGNCVAVCPMQYLSLVDNKPVQDRDKRSEVESTQGPACNDCNLCVMSCPRVEPAYYWQRRELERMKHEGGEIIAARAISNF